MNAAYLSFEYVVLLAERVRWLQEENAGIIDEKELESFLYAIARVMFLTSRPSCIYPLHSPFSWLIKILMCGKLCK